MADTVIAPDLRERWETLLLDAVDNDGEFTDEDAAWSVKMIERVSKAEAENAFLKSQEAWKRIDSMSSTIDRMTLEIAQLAVTAKRVASADEENVALRAKLQQISDWCEAYPLDVFTEPDMVEVRRMLGDTLLTQLSAHNFRHVINGVKQIAARGREGE